MKKNNPIPAYQVNISFDPRDDIFVARVPELENCHTHGKTPEKALTNAKEAIELWIESARQRRIPIPEPTCMKKFSGKFVLRTSSELHSAVATEALRHGKSMNEFAIELIDKGLRRVSRGS